MNPLIVLLVFVVSPLLAAAQSMEAGSVFFDAVPFAADSATGCRLDLVAAVPHDLLSFERAESRFVASYRAQFLVRRDGDVVFDTTFERSAIRTTAETVGATRYDYFQVPVSLEPGKYEAALELVEPRTGRTGVKRRAIAAADYSAFPFGLSGLLLVSRIHEDSIGHVITPMITDNVSSLEGGYFVFFEVYNRGPEREVLLSARHRQSGGSASAAESVRQTAPPGRSQHWLRLQVEGLSRGQHVVEVRAVDPTDTSKILAATERSVAVEGTGSGLPVGEAELDERIAQLIYVANQSDIDRIRAQGDLKSRREAFAEFWRTMDPSPGTADNEAMRQYYARVDYANEHFRSYAAGWLTDQGRIFVLYGAPDDIARQPFRTDGRAVEVWQYYSRHLELRFQDDSGFGDFRLVTPISNLEKYRYQG